jgi:hypothetical protein
MTIIPYAETRFGCTQLTHTSRTYRAQRGLRVLRPLRGERRWVTSKTKPYKNRIKAVSLCILEEIYGDRASVWRGW